jgi:hypothetical protein
MNSFEAKLRSSLATHFAGEKVRVEPEKEPSASMVGSKKPSCCVVTNDTHNTTQKNTHPGRPKFYTVIVECKHSKTQNTILRVSTSSINIEWLSLCDKKTPKKRNNLLDAGPVVQKIIDLADDLKIKNVHMKDIFSLTEIMARAFCKQPCSKCSFSVAYYYILLHGESFMNQLGFKSKKFAKEQKTNDRLRNMPIRKFIEYTRDTMMKLELKAHKERINRPYFKNQSDSEKQKIVEKHQTRVQALQSKEEIVFNALKCASAPPSIRSVQDWSKVSIRELMVMFSSTPAPEKLIRNLRTTTSGSKKCTEFESAMAMLIDFAANSLTYDFNLIYKGPRTWSRRGTQRRHR